MHVQVWGHYFVYNKMYNSQSVNVDDNLFPQPVRFVST